MAPYYGYCSNVSRDRRKKRNEDKLIPSVLESDESSKERRKNWARLIQIFTRLGRFLIFAQQYKRQLRFASNDFLTYLRYG